MALNAIFLAKRAGNAALGFGVLSNELRRFAQPTNSAAIAATATRIYVIAGNAGFATTTDLNRIYNPSTDKWSGGARLPSPRDFGMAASLSDGIHFVGGVGAAGDEANPPHIDVSAQTPEQISRDMRARSIALGHAGRRGRYVESLGGIPRPEV